MNWNAVIKSLEEEARAIAKRLETRPHLAYFDKMLDLNRMEIYITLAKALAEGTRPIEFIGSEQAQGNAITGTKNEM